MLIVLYGIERKVAQRQQIYVAECDFDGGNKSREITLELEDG